MLARGAVLCGRDRVSALRCRCGEDQEEATQQGLGCGIHGRRASAWTSWPWTPELNKSEVSDRAAPEKRALGVDHFSTRTGGGAGAGARLLHEALLELGVDSRFWHWRKAAPLTPGGRRISLWGDGPWAIRASNRLAGRLRRRRIKARLRGARRGVAPGLELFTAPVVGWETPFSRRLFAGDVAHLHWVAGLIDVPSFFGTLPARHPVVWTLRDMNPFTGGCHFSNGCRRFASGCGSCPQLSHPAHDDLSSEFLTLKTAAVAGAHLHVVAPSRWILALARESPVFGTARSFHRIPTGIATDVFRPLEKAEARTLLGLSHQGLVVALGSDRLDAHRKGLSHGLDALRRMDTDRRVRLLLFGTALPEGALPPNLPVHAMGYVRDPARLARVYAAADCFVLPSLEDNLPKTGLEALACGTPVVAFDAGGIPDFVIPGRTGLLAATGDARDLARRIDWMLSHDHERAEMGLQGRALVEREFDARAHAQAYVELYAGIVQERA